MLVVYIVLNNTYGMLKVILLVVVKSHKKHV